MFGDQTRSLALASSKKCKVSGSLPHRLILLLFFLSLFFLVCFRVISICRPSSANPHSLSPNFPFPQALAPSLSLSLSHFSITPSTPTLPLPPHDTSPPTLWDGWFTVGWMWSGVQGPGRWMRCGAPIFVGRLHSPSAGYGHRTMAQPRSDSREPFHTSAFVSWGDYSAACYPIKRWKWPQFSALKLRIEHGGGNWSELT